MPKISRVAIFQVDLFPEVLRSDAVQAFSQTRKPDGPDLDGRRCGRHGPQLHDRHRRIRGRRFAARLHGALATWSRRGDGGGNFGKDYFLHSHQLRRATREPCLRGRGHCETVGSQSGNKDVALETLV
jgi:hypothetical protein